MTPIPTIPNLLLINALQLLIFMSLWFVVAKARNRLDTVDSAWGLGFVTVAWSEVLAYPSARSLLLTVLVTIWGLRLAYHIWSRSEKKGEDRRYVEMAAKWKGDKWLRAYFSVFLLQGFLIWIISLPLVFAAGRSISGYMWLLPLGVIIWIKGFIFEAIADRQLANFLKQEKRPKVLETGLWRYSRHPNYFGELMQWWGIGIIALGAHNGWIGLLGPLTLSVLIIFISGLPPIERHRQKDKEYQAYKRRTSPLIPMPPRK